MLEKRKEYIDRLLQELKALESRVLTIKNEDTVPFSFFRESFDKTQGIMRLLHEMEVLQIDDMKRQMERLVSFLSESESRRKSDEKEAVAETSANNAPQVEDAKEAVADTQPQEVNTPPAVVEKPAEQAPPPRNVYAEKIVLPEYKNPRRIENIPPSPPAIEPVVEEFTQEERTIPRSLNDTVQTPPAVFDLKREISLNDRFLFQRELFGNDRQEMNNMMSKLNSFDNYDDAERFLKETTSWDFDNQTVTDFLAVIRKGFK